MKIYQFISTIFYKVKFDCNLIKPVILALLTIILFFTGLSIRSLWGSEGRWAEIAREMIISGNYFLPTINGNVYFDKPLLSYWIILPFSLNGIVTEASSRIPSAILGTGVILLTFLTGRRVFNDMSGFISAALISTSVMFALWSRTASAEIMNLFMIWLAFLIYLAGNYGRRQINIILLYIVGAAAAFCKGPVAPAVIFTSIGFYNTIELLINLKRKGFTYDVLKEGFFTEFCWLFSRKGLVGILTGTAFFTGLLLVPVVSTGSWQSAELMWKENVLRFFHPFDHIEPVYIYLKYIPLFFAPWTFLLLASIQEIKNWHFNRSNRFIVMLGFAIFIFFTSSGSRRSYYILPILPALAIITGKTIADWLELTGKDIIKKRIIHIAAILTSMLPLLTGIGLLLTYFRTDIPHHISQLPLGGVAIAGGITSFILFIQKKPFKGLTMLFTIIFVVELWAFTIGMNAAEKNRTLKPFSQKIAFHLKGVNDNKIALYQVGDSALIFYLKRNPLSYFSNPAEAETFMSKNNDGFIIANMSAAHVFKSKRYLKKMIPVIIEKPILHKKDDPLALFALSME